VLHHDVGDLCIRRDRDQQDHRRMQALALPAGGELGWRRIDQMRRMQARQCQRQCPCWAPPGRERTRPPIGSRPRTQLHTHCSFDSFSFTTPATACSRGFTFVGWTNARQEVNSSERFGSERSAQRRMHRWGRRRNASRRSIDSAQWSCASPELASGVP
jgi:hypothetical protein